MSRQNPGGAAGNQEEPDLQEVILQMAQLLQRMAIQQLPANNTEQILESLSSNITEFVFDEEHGVTFGRWFDRYQDLFETDAQQLDDAAKVRLLLRKLDTQSHSRYLNYILLELPKNVSFADTIRTLKKIFGQQVSTFRKRFQCLQIVKSESEDIITYGGTVNRACEEFQFTKVSLDHFKCLIFITGLKAPKYSDIRARLLSMLEHEKPEAPATLQLLIDEFQRLVNLKEDTSIIERASSKSEVHAVRNQQSAASQPTSSKQEVKKPKTPCWQCGQLHFVKECPFNNHLCKDCNRTGHKEGYCSCCKSPSAPATIQEKDKKTRKKQKSGAESKGVFIVNRIEHRERRRKFVTTFINGNPATLQLDSASDVSIISEAVWEQIGKPDIKPASSQASSASGQQLSLSGEFDCEVTIKGETKRGRCFVTPLRNLNLLGIEWIDLFNLWSVPLDSLCNHVSLPKQAIQKRIHTASILNIAAAKAPNKVAPEALPVPAKPWCRIHIDYSGPIDGCYLLVVVDPFTRWPEVVLTKSMTAPATIKLLKQMFATFGIPQTVVSDNGTQFTSHEFQQFCESLGVRHIRTAPFHPQSNGQAERFVDTVKRSLKKIRSGGESLEEALQTFLTVYRSTPTSDLDGKSPAEVMMGRPMRTVSALLKPAVRAPPASKTTGASSRYFNPGDAVYAQVHRANTRSWKPGVIIERIGKITYNILLDDNHRLIRSHTNQVRRRSAESMQASVESPLSIFLDGFGLLLAPVEEVPVNPVVLDVQQDLPLNDDVPPLFPDSVPEPDDNQQSPAEMKKFHHDPQFQIDRDDSSGCPPTPGVLIF